MFEARHEDVVLQCISQTTTTPDFVQSEYGNTEESLQLLKLGFKDILKLLHQDLAY